MTSIASAFSRPTTSTPTAKGWSTQPTLMLIAQWHLKHRWRRGGCDQCVSAAAAVSRDCVSVSEETSFPEGESLDQRDCLRGVPQRILHERKTRPIVASGTVGASWR